MFNLHARVVKVTFFVLTSIPKYIKSYALIYSMSSKRLAFAKSKALATRQQTKGVIKKAGGWGHGCLI